MGAQRDWGPAPEFQYQDGADVRMQERVVIFAVVALLGVPVLGLSFGKVTPVAVLVLVVWTLLCMGAQFLFFRCPHCGRNAGIRPNGSSSPFVGSECAYCGEEY